MTDAQALISALISKFREEESRHKQQAAAQAPMGGSLYVRHHAQWEMAKQHADDLETLLAAQLEKPLFWQHAISECNEAHQVLDRLGAPKTTTVMRRSGEGHQEITIGLRDRILSLKLASADPPPARSERAEKAFHEDPDQFIVPHLLRALSVECCCGVCETLRESQEAGGEQALREPSTDLRKAEAEWKRLKEVGKFLLETDGGRIGWNKFAADVLTALSPIQAPETP